MSLGGCRSSAQRPDNRFLGQRADDFSSLAAHRTIQTFIRVVQDEGRDTLPHHYALIASPDDAEKKRTIDQRLADAHITPRWYPDGEHEYVEQVLELLFD